MPYSSPEVLQLEAIRDWIATLAVWSEWVGSEIEAELKARVVWPLKSAPALPVAILSLRGGSLNNSTGAAGGANFQPTGTIAMQVYAANTGGDDEQLGYTVFADLFYRLIAGMADAAHQSPVFFNSFTTPEVPIIRSSWVSTEDDEGLGDWWQGEVMIRWGVEA